MMNKGRVLLLLLDSFGIGASKDASDFGDQGSNTFLHILEACKDGKADSKMRSGALKIPNLKAKGLYKAAQMSCFDQPNHPLLFCDSKINSAYGYAKEISKGKDTSSGHWEIAGAPVFRDWYYFKKDNKKSCFPENFIYELIHRSGLAQGFYDAGHASGTDVIRDYGDQHIQTLKPIIYTSADSVFQIAAHENYFSLKKLYELCELARSILDEQGMNVARVIARPFTTEVSGDYKRTSNRHDYSVLPPEKTLLDKIKDQGGSVISIGKIADIFAEQGITSKVKASGLTELFDQSIKQFSKSKPGSITFTNFVDFDSEYGHRRNVSGYASALEFFDKRLPEVDAILEENDMVIITADHGCDPTWHGTDHTREHIPFLYWGENIKPGSIGERSTFADIGQTIAEFLDVDSLSHGESSLWKRDD